MCQCSWRCPDQGNTDIKPLFIKSSSLLSRLAVCVLLSLVLMGVDHRYQQLETLRAGLSLIVYPIRAGLQLPVDLITWASENLATRQTLVRENARLRRENLLLQSRTQRYAALNTENQRLRALLDSSVKVGERVLVADLLASELAPSRRQVVLDKGSRQGVYNGQPVVDANGVMGQVVHVGPVTCTVMLITDPAHALPVQINRTGLRAIARGTGERGQLELSYIPNNADVHSGDLIVSSGLGGRFPSGYPVARVTRVEIHNGQPFATISAAPSAHLQQAREALLVWPGTAGGQVDDYSLGSL